MMSGFKCPQYLDNNLLDDVPLMVERLHSMVADDFVDIGLEMFVLIEPSVNVGSKC